MGEFRAIHRYLAVVVVLVACHEAVMNQGRQIKANQHSRMNKPTIPNHHVHAVSGVCSNVEYVNVNAYRPTMPGNSPGVGHKKFGEENKDINAKMVVVESPDVKHYSATSEGSKTDFRPTGPGQSPGVGHAAHQNNNNREIGRVRNEIGN